MKVNVITLGCDKNTVDSERYLARLADHGVEATDDPSDADVILVNTCGFIDAAKKESIDALVDAASYKTAGRCTAVVAVGCMVERHKDELAAELPEIDLFLGSSEVERLIPALGERGLLSPDIIPVAHPGVRLFSGERPHIRYLKISEGCDHGCAFCAIPLMRGKHRSFTLDDVVAEAQLLEAQGAREINLVAQDLAHWGRDRRDERRTLPDLLEALIRETSIPWIRMLYVYSAGLNDRMLDLVAREKRIVPYLDIPIQHASNAVLARMRRPERLESIRSTLVRLRAAIPDVAIRTTCIVGFPGETDDDVTVLSDLLEEAAFDRVGFFTYSAQAGTRAAELDDDVPESVKHARLERLQELQRLITAEKNESRLGATVEVMIDRNDHEGVEARTVYQADDIDGITYLDGADELLPGTIVTATLGDVIDDVNFAATVQSVVSTPAPPARRTRSLPMVPASVGSYGR